MSLFARAALMTTAVVCLGPACLAQLTVPPTPLAVDDNFPVVQSLPFTTLSDPQCDSAGTLYLRHESADNSSWDLMRVSADGSTQQVALAAVPGFDESHTFVMNVADGGSIEEIVRGLTGKTSRKDASIYLLQFDRDGSFRSRQPFSREFIPSSLIPLPSGDFFAAGVVVKKQTGMDDIEEVPLAGIFDSVAQLRSRLRDAPGNLHHETASASQGGGATAEALQQGGFARLGDDGDLYVLLNLGSNTRVRVFRQSGELRRDMKLQQPFQEGLATGLWISSGRILVSYEGETDNPKDSVTYILYDANTGEMIRAYRPQFTGTVACFQDGQSVTVLVKEERSGRLKIGRVELE